MHVHNTMESIDSPLTLPTYSRSCILEHILLIFVTSSLSSLISTTSFQRVFYIQKSSKTYFYSQHPLKHILPSRHTFNLLLVQPVMSPKSIQRLWITWVKGTRPRRLQGQLRTALNTWMKHYRGPENFETAFIKYAEVNTVFWVD